MAVYMTKTWGFADPSGPLQFSEKGWRERARKILKPHDLVVIVGTLGDETRLDERGKILGLMEPTTQTVSSLDYQLVRGPGDFDEEGKYRWPFGLELTRAWKFAEPKRLLSEITQRRFNMDAAQGIVLLRPEEAEAILNLARREIELIQPLRARARIEGHAAARRKVAPPPTTTRTGVMHMRRAPAYTYAMQLEGTSREAMKIGWAFDYKTRERQFNLPALPELGGVRYRTKLFHLWDTAMDAFRMEQMLLRRFEGLRHSSNSEVLTPVDLATVQEAWARYLIEKSKRKS